MQKTKAMLSGQEQVTTRTTGTVPVQVPIILLAEAFTCNTYNHSCKKTVLMPDVFLLGILAMAHILYCRCSYVEQPNVRKRLTLPPKITLRSLDPRISCPLEVLPSGIDVELFLVLKIVEQRMNKDFNNSSNAQWTACNAVLHWPEA